MRLVAMVPNKLLPLLRSYSHGYNVHYLTSICYTSCLVFVNQ